MNKFKTVLVICISLVLLITFVDKAFSKCPYVAYKISGVVQDADTKKMISQASLLFFFDNEESTLAAGHETKYPDYFKSNEQGQFLATAYFDSYSGSFPTDRCNKKPETLTAIVIADGYLTKRLTFKVHSLKVINELTLQLPGIEMKK